VTASLNSRSRKAEVLATVPGIKQARVARTTGVVVAVVRREIDGETHHVAMCMDHGEQVIHETYDSARRSLPEPEEWCGTCCRLYWV